MGNLRLRPSSGQPIDIDADRTLVGRESTCDVVLQDKSVSRRHAFIERRGAAWFVVDQGSANGTFVNGAQVSEAEIVDGQELRFGTLVTAVEIESDMPQTVLMSTPSFSAPPPPPPRPAASPSPARPAPGRAAAAPSFAAAAPAAPAAASVPALDPREQAARTLGLPATASAYDVSQRYAELAAELEQKAAAAPTPNLQATYRRRLEDLGRAAELLAPGFSPNGDADADLPSAHPVVVPESLGDSMMEPVRPAPVVRDAAPAPAAGPPMATTALGALLVMMLGSSGYFWMSQSRTAKDLAALQKSSDLSAARAEWQKYEPIDQLEKAGALRNGPLAFCNRSAQPIDVAWLGAVALGVPKEAGQPYTVKTYNSLLCRQEFKLSLPPGAETPVSFASDNERCRWDGQGVFFGLYVRRMVPGTPARPGAAAPPATERTEYVSGLLNGQPGCVNIGEGW
jgi:pSer/pThr/pTyr-binding forkhead associated (FHA) protein